MNNPALSVTLTAASDALRVSEALLASKSPNTRLAYENALRQFSAHYSLEAILESRGYCAETLLAWQAHLKGLWEPTTVNLHLTALRSFLKTARRLDVISWAVEIKPLPVTAFRDCSGPDLDSLKRLFRAAQEKGAREYAIVRLFFDCGLRRAELGGITLADLDGERCWITGKGRLQREAISLPDKTREAISAWVVQRGADPGSLFGLCDHSLWRIIRDLGGKAGIKDLHPHSLRHSGISQLLAANNGNIHQAQKFARHSSPATTTIYADRLSDLAGEASKKLSELLP
jgi:integrase/recombinase XerC